MSTEVNANERKKERLLEDVYPDVYPSGINVPKHFTVVLYCKFKKLRVVKFKTSICFSIL